VANGLAYFASLLVLLFGTFIALNMDTNAIKLFLRHWSNNKLECLDSFYG
jgi:hypothetical protein